MKIFDNITNALSMIPPIYAQTVASRTLMTAIAAIVGRAIDMDTLAP